MTRPVERRARMERAEFQRQYETSPGRPVIVTDVVPQWPAASKWTLEFFEQAFGEDIVVVTDRIGRPTVGQRVPLAEYIEYVRQPDRGPLAAAAADGPFYLTTFSPFVEHAALMDDFAEPSFLENWYRSAAGPLRDWYLTGFGWIFIGPRGTVTPSHADLFGTHAWLAQLTGRKRCAMAAAGDPNDVHACVLEPGDFLFIPQGWLHEVVSLEPSITLSFNYVNASNFAAHIAATIEQMPAWLRKAERYRAPRQVDPV